MTKQTLDQINAAIAENDRALSQASADAALYARLKGASAEEARLRKEGDILTRRRSEAMDAELKAERAAFAKTVRNLRITSGKHGAGALDSYVIEWDGLQYNSNLHDNEWVRKQCEGFAALAPQLYAYILTECPERIPAPIMALCPDDPSMAVSQHLTGLKRGWA